MKKIIASLVLAIIALLSFGCTDKLPEEEFPEKEMPYNVLYDAKFVDKSERYMTEEFINELGYAGDFPKDKMLIIDNQEEFKRVYKLFPYEVDFSQEILFIYMFVDTNYGFECKLQDMHETDSELTIEVFHDSAKGGSHSGSAPMHRCLAVKLTNFKYNETKIKYIENYPSGSYYENENI